MKILIAEDDITSCCILEKLLSAWGYETVTAHDGISAWKILSGPDAPQLALLDWNMPGLDGADICRMARKEEPLSSSYIILLTARNSSQDTASGLEAGADDYISKPYNPQELNARIRVGLRVLEFQEHLRARQKLEGIVQMAATVSHEFNQPLQVITLSADLLLERLEMCPDACELVAGMREQLVRLAGLTRKIMQITGYSTKEYIDDKNMMIDLESVSENQE